MRSLLRLHPPEKTTLLLLCLGSAGALTAAFIAQYGFKLAPCHLCLLQRYPHAGVMLLGAGGARFLCNPRWLRASLGLCIVALLIGGGIATYHAGVEAGVFPGPSGCTSRSTGDESLDDLRRAILDAPLVSCDQPLGEVLGLSLAVWSALIYAFLTIVASYGYYRAVSPVSSGAARKEKQSHVG